MELGTYLAGVWAVERRVLDAELGEGHFRGRATFTRRGDDLVWTEDGRFRLGAYDGPARRELLVGPGGDVRFADGRPFHALDLSNGSCAVEHPCGEDRYDGEYAVLGPDAFEVLWRVRGPRKDQRLVSRYERIV